MVPYILLLVLGGFIALYAMSRYPLLDTRLAMAVHLSLFVFSAASITIDFVQYQGNGGGGWLRVAFFVSCLALITFGILLLVNGGLDRSPSSDMSVKVLQKTVFKGRVTQYRLFVSSWRPGVSREDLNVVSSVFDRAVVGKNVTVKLHPGYLGLPWYAGVIPTVM